MNTAWFKNCKGRFEKNVSMKEHTWFRVGGSAKYFYRPQNIDELVDFIQKKPSDLKLFVIGAGSNILVRDGGFPGCIIKLGSGFSKIEVIKETSTIIAGAGCLDRTIALMACEAEIGGFEFLSGIPGNLGGALAMNAGAYGFEMKDLFLWAEAIDSQGNIHKVDHLEMEYRHTHFPKDWIFTTLALKGYASNQNTIQKKIDAILKERESTQPIKSRTGGSTFKNPAKSDLKAWQLIDMAGYRGKQVGQAMISTLHCNFLINLGDASATDIETLGETVRKRVKATSGVNLEWEIIRIGDPLKENSEA